MSVSDIENKFVRCMILKYLLPPFPELPMQWQRSSELAKQTIEELYLIVWMDGIVLKFVKTQNYQQNHLFSSRFKP